MDLNSKKLQFIQWFSGITNPEIIKAAVALQKESQDDWWDLISLEEKEKIMKGLEQADKGDLIPNSEVFAKYKKWMSK